MDSSRLLEFDDPWLATATARVLNEQAGDELYYVSGGVSKCYAVRRRIDWCPDFMRWRRDFSRWMYGS